MLYLNNLNKMDTDIILTDMLNINFDIEKNHFRKTVFLNEALENHFQKNMEENSFKNNLLSNGIIILGFLASLMFILVCYFKIIYLSVCLFLFCISMLTLAYSIYNKNKEFRYITDNIQILLSFLNLLIKSIVASVYYNSENNEMELLRIMIYQALSTNIYMIIKLEANIFISLFYMLLNTIVIIISILFCTRNHHFYLEIVINFCIFLIFYLLRKKWDIKLRHLFAEKYKNKKSEFKQ